MQVRPETYSPFPSWVKFITYVLFVPMSFLVWQDDEVNIKLNVFYTIFFASFPILISIQSIEITEVGVVANYWPFRKKFFFKDVERIKFAFPPRGYGVKYLFARLSSGKLAYFPIEGMCRHNIQWFEENFNVIDESARI